jgi:hypothetical protein
VLLEQYGHRAICDARIQLNAKVSRVLCDKSWHWPPTRSESLVKIQSQLYLVNNGSYDLPVWSISSKGIYNCAHVREFI